METKTIQVFGFKELEDSVKEKVLNKNREINLDYDWWDFVIEDFIREANELGFEIKEKDITFELDQGSEFSIDGKNFIIKQDILKGYKVCAYIDTYQSRIGYNQANEFDLIVEEMYKGNRLILNEEDRDEEVEIELEGIAMGMIWKQVEEKLNEKIQKLLNLCEKYYTILRKQYEYNYSDEGIEETFEANEFRFLKDGRVF